MKITLVTGVVLGALLLAPQAGARVSLFVSFHWAKGEIARDTREFCRRERGCVGWKAQPCAAVSHYRLVCRTVLHHAEGTRCVWLTSLRVFPRRGTFTIFSKHRRCGRGFIGNYPYS